MTLARLKKIKQRLNELRKNAHNLQPNDLIRLARALGRKRFKRGKEPTYISPISVRPLSIPYHSTALKQGTARNILDQLEQDIYQYEELLDGDDENED